MRCLKQCVGEGRELKVGRKEEDGDGDGDGEMRECLGHADEATLYFRRKQLLEAN